MSKLERARAAVSLGMSLAVSLAALSPSPGRAQELSDATRLGVGVRARYVFLPTSLLNLFVSHSTPMESTGIGAEIAWRKRNFDVVVGLEYDGAAPANGLYLERGDDPSVPGEYPDYLEFEDFGLLGVDVAFVWHARLHDRVDLRYGAGIGAAAVLGSIYQTDTTCAPGTTPKDLDDPSACAPVPGSRQESDDVPPVIPIVNALAGVRFQVTDQLAINVEGGFRDMFFMGASAGFFF